MLNGKLLIEFLVHSVHVDSARIENETGRTVTISFVTTRENFTVIERRLDNDRVQYELRGIERMHKTDSRASETQHGTYRYTVLFFKL